VLDLAVVNDFCAENILFSSRPIHSADLVVSVCLIIVRHMYVYVSHVQLSLLRVDCYCEVDMHRLSLTSHQWLK